MYVLLVGMQANTHVRTHTSYMYTLTRSSPNENPGYAVDAGRNYRRPEAIQDLFIPHAHATNGCQLIEYGPD